MCQSRHYKVPSSHLKPPGSIPLFVFAFFRLCFLVEYLGPTRVTLLATSSPHRLQIEFQLQLGYLIQSRHPGVLLPKFRRPCFHLRMVGGPIKNDWLTKTGILNRFFSRGIFNSQRDDTTKCRFLYQTWKKRKDDDDTYLSSTDKEQITVKHANKTDWKNRFLIPKIIKHAIHAQTCIQNNIPNSWWQFPKPCHPHLYDYE